MQTILAADPGLSGGIAWQIGGGVEAIKMPLAGKDLDLATLAKIIRDINPTWMIIEKVGAMPKQGVSSMFKFGLGYGALQGVAAGLQIPVELVTPQRWKKIVLHGTTKDKDAAIAYCRRAFPDVPLVPKGCRVPSDGIADALCLLEYGRRELLGIQNTEILPDLVAA